ncbi:MAG: ABC transporter ATP-binding protein [Firmicutes bacterium]|nr:ABC transporter ATP-binding protein [Bacillota bacterium]
MSKTAVIEIRNLNFSYPNGKGVFDINFDVRKGQVVGFLGPNGAGKTTTIRCILGFMKGTTGDVTIDGLDCFKDAPRIAHKVGYIAGEPAFPSGMSGIEFLNFLINVRVEQQGKESSLDKKALQERMENLVKYFELDPRSKIKSMSKGMKQKTAIIAACMHDPDVYILDEPSSGLDPLMQAKLVEFMQNEKARGKTIMISSHIFEEVERMADRILIIKDGRIVKEDNVKNLKNSQRKIFNVMAPGIVKKIKMSKDFDVNVVSGDEVEILVPIDKVNMFIKELAKFDIQDVTQRTISLEEIFMQFYESGEKSPLLTGKGGVS